MDDDMKLADATVVGMTRSPDHKTSIAAAEMVNQRKATIREQVIAFALSRPFGFSDDDLKIAFPDMPESSARKRRTELSQENVIICHGEERPNRKGQNEKVWYHRDHCQFPPPLKERAATRRFDQLQEEIARLKAERDSALARVAELEAAARRVVDDYEKLTGETL